jgi:hypothetical protein
MSFGICMYMSVYAFIYLLYICHTIFPKTKSISLDRGLVFFDGLLSQIEFIILLSVYQISRYRS